VEVDRLILLMSEKEKEMFDKWVDKEKYGWPIKEGCPDDIRKKIEEINKRFDEEPTK